MRNVLLMALGALLFSVAKYAYTTHANNTGGRYTYVVNGVSYTCVNDIDGRICYDHRGIRLDMGQGDDYWTREAKREQRLTGR